MRCCPRDYHFFFSLICSGLDRVVALLTSMSCSLCEYLSWWFLQVMFCCFTTRCLVCSLAVKRRRSTTRFFWFRSGIRSGNADVSQLGLLTWVLTSAVETLSYVNSVASCSVAWFVWVLDLSSTLLLVRVHSTKRRRMVTRLVSSLDFQNSVLFLTAFATSCSLARLCTYSWHE